MAIMNTRRYRVQTIKYLNNKWVKSKYKQVLKYYYNATRKSRVYTTCVPQYSHLSKYRYTNSQSVGNYYHDVGQTRVPYLIQSTRRCRNYSRYSQRKHIRTRTHSSSLYGSPREITAGPILVNYARWDCQIFYLSFALFCHVFFFKYSFFQNSHQ